jgi:hypothetical protein
VCRFDANGCGQSGPFGEVSVGFGVTYPDTRCNLITFDATYSATTWQYKRYDVLVRDTFDDNGLSWSGELNRWRKRDGTMTNGNNGCRRGPEK